MWYRGVNSYYISDLLKWDKVLESSALSTSIDSRSPHYNYFPSWNFTESTLPVNIVPHTSRSSLSILSFLRGPQVSTLPLNFPQSPDFYPLPLTQLHFRYHPIFSAIPSSCPEKRLIQTILLMKHLLHTSEWGSFMEANEKLDNKDFFDRFVQMKMNITIFSSVSWKRRQL